MNKITRSSLKTIFFVLFVVISFSIAEYSDKFLIVLISNLSGWAGFIILVSVLLEKYEE